MKGRSGATVQILTTLLQFLLIPNQEINIKTTFRLRKFGKVLRGKAQATPIRSPSQPRGYETHSAEGESMIKNHLHKQKKHHDSRQSETHILGTCI